MSQDVVELVLGKHYYVFHVQFKGLAGIAFITYNTLYKLHYTKLQCYVNVSFNLFIKLQLIKSLVQPTYRIRCTRTLYCLILVIIK